MQDIALAIIQMANENKAWEVQDPSLSGHKTHYQAMKPIAMEFFIKSSWW